MQTFTYLIIGGGVAGTTAAETIRKNDTTGTIGIISDEPYRLYSRVMLSKPAFFLEKIPFDSIWLKDEPWYKEKKIEFLGGKEAIEIHAEQKTVSLDDGMTVGYEKLLIATGGHVRYWNMQGAQKNGIYYLHTLDDGKKIISAIKTAKKAITIGGGVISFEMAELLKQAGLDVTMLIRENYYWSPTLDEESGTMIEETLQKNGITLLKNTEVKEILGNDTVEGVILNNERKLDCDMIICGIGIVCGQDWFTKSGLTVNRGIITNEYLETNIKDIWAAGDIAEYNDLILEETVQLGNWVNAREQGVTAGLNMTCAEKKPFKFVSFYTTQGLGINIGFVGDARPGDDRVIIKRGSPKINSYARLITVDNELIGATLINRTQELTAIANIIKYDVNIAGKESDLANINFDLKSLIP
ncbi:MAG: FAD-dependent oxidoreductase [bacterium]